MKFLLLLSGPVAVGKSGVANALIKDHGFASIKSSAYLRAQAASDGLSGRSVFHVHLIAPEPIIEARYNDRLLAGDEAGNIAYATAIAHPNELSSRSLIDVADFLVDLASSSSEAAGLAIVEKWNEREVNASDRFD